MMADVTKTFDASLLLYPYSEDTCLVMKKKMKIYMILPADTAHHLRQ